MSVRRCVGPSWPMFLFFYVKKMTGDKEQISNRRTQPLMNKEAHGGHGPSGAQQVRRTQPLMNKEAQGGHGPSGAQLVRRMQARTKRCIAQCVLYKLVIPLIISGRSFFPPPPLPSATESENPQLRLLWLAFERGYVKSTFMPDRVEHRSPDLHSKLPTNQSRQTIQKFARWFVCRLCSRLAENHQVRSGR